MRFIVTGGCGFVGSAVVRTLSDAGHHVLNIDRKRKSAACPALASIAGNDGYVRLEADVADRSMMRAVFREFQPESVIHLAGAVVEDGEAVFDAEVAGAFSILEACRGLLPKQSDQARGAFRIVHAIHAEAADNDNTNTPSPLDAARSAASALIDGWSRSHSLPLVTCVADQVFGPWQPDASLLPSLVSALISGRSHRLEAAGERARDWLPVRDFASGLIRAAGYGAPLSRYEFSVGAERRDLDIAEAACAMLDNSYTPPGGSWASLLALDGDPRDAPPPPMLDPSDAEAELAWRPLGFHAGFDRAMTWAVARFQPAQPSPALAAE